MKKDNNLLFKAGFLIILFLIIRFALRFDGLYGQDAYEYLRYTNEMFSFFTNGTSLGDYFWGLGYPFFGSIFNLFVRNASIALQLVSLTAVFITWLYIDKIIALIYNETTNYWVSFLFFVLSPIIFIHSFLVMSDLLACCFSTMAIYYFILFIVQSQSKNCILAVIASVLSIHTRYASSVIMLVFFIFVFLKLIELKKTKTIMICILMGILISIPHFYVRSNNSINFLSNTYLTEWNILNLFKSSFNTIDGVSHNNFINLIYCLYPFVHPQLFAIGSLIIVLIIRNKNSFFKGNTFQNYILISILAYTIFLGGIPFQNKRFLILSFPLVIILSYPILNQILSGNKFGKLLTSSILILQFGLSIYFGKPFYERNKLEQAIAKDIIKHSGKTIYIFDMDIALKGRHVQLDYQNIWLKEYSSFNEGAIVLVNATKIEKQWVGKKPFINWDKLKKNKNLKVLKTYSDGWNLYQVQ